MALDYDKRIDFRAFDVLADGIESASTADIQRAIESCDAIARNWSAGETAHVEIKRLLFKGFANLMRLHLRKFRKPSTARASG